MKEFPQLKNNLYLDSAGCPPIPMGLMEAFSRDLQSNHYGNPHSNHNSGSLTDRKVLEMRRKILQHFNVTENDYSVIFTSNASNALKLIADSILVDDKIWFLAHNHTSVVGMGPILQDRLGIQPDTLTEEKIYEYLKSDECASATGLFAYPAQCNFSGKRFDMDWIKKFQSKNWLVLLDTASYLSTSRLDLNHYPADFATLSFYKLFGFPTGLGGLLVKRSASKYLKKSFVGGGTVAAIAINPFYARMKPFLHEQFEDGTIPFHQILAIEYGFNYIESRFGSWNDYGKYCNKLVVGALKKMNDFKYPNGAKVFKIFENNVHIDRGPIIAFCLLDETGNNIGYSQVMRLAATENIHLRAGRFCNPGAAQTYLVISSEEIKDWKEILGHFCGDSNDKVHEKATGALRISFSYVNTSEDIEKFLIFIQEYFFISNLKMTNSVANSDDISIELDDIIIFPIKSCKGFHVKQSILETSGLQYDREFMLIDRNGQILTQKKYAKLNGIKVVELNIASQTLVVSAPGSGSVVIDLNNDEDDSFFKSAVNICGRSSGTIPVSSNAVQSWFADYLGIDCYLVRRAKFNRSFANSSQYLLVSSTSVDALKDDIPEENHHVSALSFRPNFLFEGKIPFIEENWVGKEILINGIKFHVTGLCERCNMVNVDEQCQRHKEPLRTLAKRPRINGKIVFGVHLSRTSSDAVTLCKINTTAGTVVCHSQKFTFLEALLESEKGHLQIFNGNIPMSIQQAYDELGVDLNAYQVFSELKSKGFHLFESAKTIPLSIDPKNAKPKGIMSYLKRIFVDTLVAPWDYYSLESIKTELDIIDQKPVSEEKENKMIQFDTYRPASKFKKSSRGSPDFVLRILDSSENLTYSHLAELCSPVPVKVAVVEGDSINYLSIENFKT